MKKINWLIIVFMLFAINAYSKKVEPHVVKQVAENAWKLKNGDFYRMDIKVKKLLPYTEADDTLIYIANFDSGFIIVSADNSSIPILGYSIDTNFDITNIPPALTYLLNCYKKEIIEIKKQKISADKKIEGEWNSLMDGVQLKSANTISSAVGPLLSSSWDQGYPYNQYCPAGTPAGCVAVAFAQVLYYWNCRVNATGQHSYKSDYRTETANFGTANYQWSNMDTLHANSANAWLIYHCGVSVNMDYSHDGSSANMDDVEIALQTYFGFKDQAQVRSRINHPFDWKSILKANLNYGWPILYRGQDAAFGSSAHAWVIDGYDSSDQFHCNWGWGGTANGFFSLGGLNPVTSNGTRDYNELQQALVDIEPQRSVAIGTPQLIAKTFIYSPNGYTLTIPAVDGATSYQWITSNGTITGTSTTALLKSDCSATVQVRAYNENCSIYSPYSSGQVTINYEPISGPSLVCSSGATFTISNLPPVNSIVWIPGPGLTITSGQNTPSCKFSATGNGLSWVKATLDIGCGSLNPSLQLTVWAGALPNPTSIIGFASNGKQFGSDTYYDFSVPFISPFAQATYNWTVGGGTILWGQGTGTITVKTGTVVNNNIYFNVGVRASNSCGSTSYFVRTGFVVSGTGGATRIIISPNPSTGETTLELADSNMETLSQDTQWDIEVYDAMQALKTKFQKIKGSKQTINTSGWKDGVYIVRAKIGNKIINEKLVVKH